MNDGMPSSDQRRKWPIGFMGGSLILVAFCLIQTLLPLRTAVQIGADEGFELAKMTLCVHGHK